MKVDDHRLASGLLPDESWGEHDFVAASSFAREITAPYDRAENEVQSIILEKLRDEVVLNFGMWSVAEVSLPDCAGSLARYIQSSSVLEGYQSAVADSGRRELFDSLGLEEGAITQARYSAERILDDNYWLRADGDDRALLGAQELHLKVIVKELGLRQDRNYVGSVEFTTAVSELYALIDTLEVPDWADPDSQAGRNLAASRADERRRWADITAGRFRPAR